MIDFTICYLTWYLFICTSVTVPERLELVVNKYAEHTHEKWSLEKVIDQNLNIVLNLSNWLKMSPLKLMLHTDSTFFYTFFLLLNSKFFFLTVFQRLGSRRAAL